MSRDLVRLISEMNQAWLDGRFDELSRYFTPDVIMLLPGSKQTIQGVENMINSYKAFTQNATVHQFKIENLTLFEHEGFDIVHGEFDVEYEFNGKKAQGKFLEIYVVAHVRGQLKIAWRTQKELG